MNAEEGVSLAKMAVTVLLVVLIIGAVVAIVYAAYSWFTSGSDKLTDQVVSIDKSSFSQYDDQTVSGTDVLSCLKSYRESDICILVANASDASWQYQVLSADTTVNGVPNYCALVDGVSTSYDSTNQCYPAAVKYTSSTGKWSIAGIEWENNQAKRNTNFSPTTTNSNTKCYVKSSAKWYANLVYDETTDEIAGILFRQMK